MSDWVDRKPPTAKNNNKKNLPFNVDRTKAQKQDSIVCNQSWVDWVIRATRKEHSSRGQTHFSKAINNELNKVEEKKYVKKYKEKWVGQMEIYLFWMKKMGFISKILQTTIGSQRIWRAAGL